jgi:hypothetical protein
MRLRTFRAVSGYCVGIDALHMQLPESGEGVRFQLRQVLLALGVGDFRVGGLGP